MQISVFQKRKKLLFLKSYFYVKLQTDVTLFLKKTGGELNLIKIFCKHVNLTFNSDHGILRIVFFADFVYYLPGQVIFFKRGFQETVCGLEQIKKK